MHSNEFRAAHSEKDDALLVDNTTGYIYSMTEDEGLDFTAFGKVPQDVIELATQDRGQHTIDLARAEVQAGFDAIEARREQRATDAKVARWAAGDQRVR